MNLSNLDCGIIIGYIIAIVGVCIYLNRRASGSMEDYFLAGRRMPWWALGISNMAVWLDMTGTMIITSFLFLLGPRGLFIEFRGGACLILALLMLWVGKWHRRSGVITGAEWMVYRFGKNFWGQSARIACVLATVLGSIGMMAYALKGAGLFLSMFVPLSPLVCTIIMLVVTTVYTLAAGFYGVVVTDIAQSVCIAIGVVYIMAISIAHVAGCPDLAALAVQITGNKEWTSTLPQMHTTMPAGYEQYGSLVFVMVFYLFKVMIQGLGAGAEPRYFGAKSDRDCGLLTFQAGWLMACRWPLMLGIAVLGLFLVKDLFPDQGVIAGATAVVKAEVPNVTENQWADAISSISNNPEKHSAAAGSLKQILGDDWQKKIHLVGYKGILNPERILPAVLLYKVPMGLRGLLVLALFAAAMSAMNCAMNVATSFMTRDVYQAFIRPKATSKELMLATYTFGTCMALLAFYMAYYTKNINDIWGWITSGLISGLMMPLALRFHWWRFNGSGFAIGTLVGMAGAVLQRIFLPDMNEWWQFVYIAGTGLTGCIIGTYMTPATDKQVLEHFYRTTRPFGLWKPLQSILSPELLASTKKEHRNDLCAVPFALLWQVTILLMPMQLIIKAYNAFYATLAVFIIALIGLYFLWYRNLPKRVQEVKS